MVPGTYLVEDLGLQTGCRPLIWLVEPCVCYYYSYEQPGYTQTSTVALWWPHLHRGCTVTTETNYSEHEGAKAAVFETEWHHLPAANASLWLMLTGKSKWWQCGTFQNKKILIGQKRRTLVILTHPKDTPVALTYTDNTALTHCTAYFFFPPNDIFSVFFFCASLNKNTPLC